MMRTRRRMIYVAAALALGFAVALALGEVLLRAFDPAGVRERAGFHFVLWEGMQPSSNPERVWEMKPGYRTRRFGNRIALNSLGFRGPQIATPKPSDILRVLCLGDSMTFGMSIDQKLSYPAQLEAMLRERPWGRGAEVINAGVLGYTTLQEEALLRSAIDPLQPDVVVLWWYHNDVNLTGSASPGRPAGDLFDFPALRRLTPVRRAINLAYKIAPCTVALARAATIGRDDGDDSHFAFSIEAHPEGWRRNRGSLMRIMDLCRERGIPLIVYSFGRYEPVAEACREGGAPYVTSVERAGKEHEELYAIHRVDPHFNREGNHLVAETVLAAIETAVESAARDD